MDPLTPGNSSFLPHEQMPSTNFILRANHVGYRYRSNWVLNDITFDAANGITALLGPNGAGKSTLLDILALLRRPKSGSVLLNGVELTDEKSIRQARQSIGYLPQKFSLDGLMTAKRHVEYSAWLNGVSADSCSMVAENALETVGLSDLSKARARTLSGGQAQRLGIACAIVTRPSVLLMDEPTVGLDPMQRIEFRNFLQRLARDTCIIVSTHLVEDVQYIADKLIVLDSGCVAFNGSVSELEIMGNNSLSPMNNLESGYYEVLRGSK